MRMIIVVCLELISLLTITSCGADLEENVVDDAPRQIEIFFLGHASEHHNSHKFMPLLASALAKDGINFTYSENPDDLNRKNLDKYDGLLLYANHDSINMAQEKALLNYVSEGHAFIPIHSASYCFRNSKEYIDLVGGQFLSHGADTFITKITTASHPAMKGISPFSTWDETYVHHKLADDITVLMVRQENGVEEPVTWVKESENGKVFYTAYGHDERTWANPGFHQLIKSGIVWAVSDQVRANWEAFAKDIPTLKYKEVSNIPNYEKRDPPLQYQLPLSAEASSKLIQVPAGFQLQLFASEPDIINPISMGWDEKGRLWVIETVDYPNSVRESDGQGDDKIKILEDTDGDGKADKVTIFADNLNIPTSFTFSKGGIIVSQAPHFVFLKDTDGDDVADVREIIMDGWGVFDTHAGPSNLQNGIDNHIYGVVGYSGFKGKIFNKEEAFRQGIYKFDPDLQNFEFLTNTSNNTWGLGITEDNEIFASTANNTHSVHFGIPNRLFTEMEKVSFSGSQKIDGHYDMQPITQNVRQVDVFGGFTAAAGHHFYTARLYPEEYWNKVAFVCEPTGGLVHMAKIEKEGSSYIEKDGRNFFASSDEWVSPVEAKVGPDGVVWVADWYNFIIQHNPTPSVERGGYDAENGKGNAYVNPLRDKSKGRIWRVVPKHQELDRHKNLQGASEKDLIKAFTDDNLFWRLTAQRLLVEQGSIKKVKLLTDLIKNSNDSKKLEPSAIHAIWALQGLGLIESNQEIKELMTEVLRYPSAAIRRAAIQAMPKSNWADRQLLEQGVLSDIDPSVKLAAILSFADREPSEEVGKKLYELTKKRSVQQDSWLAQATYISSATHKKGFAKAFEKEYPNMRFPRASLKSEEKTKVDGRRIAQTFMQNFAEELTVKDEDQEFSELDRNTIYIKTIKNEMKYDVTDFEVEAGKPVKIVFENIDFMQHNLVLVARGQKEKVGIAADKLAADPKGADMAYVPDMKEVIFASKLIDPQEIVTMEFIAPESPGIYPFICTFPGHWRIMQGVMRVRPSQSI